MVARWVPGGGTGWVGRVGARTWVYLGVQGWVYMLPYGTQLGIPSQGQPSGTQPGIPSQGQPVEKSPKTRQETVSREKIEI